MSPKVWQFIHFFPEKVIFKISLNFILGAGSYRGTKQEPSATEGEQEITNFLLC